MPVSLVKFYDGCLQVLCFYGNYDTFLCVTLTIAVVFSPSFLRLAQTECKITKEEKTP